MMATTSAAITVSGLGKQYRIGRAQQRHDRLTESIMHALKAPVRRLRRLGQPAPSDELIWALRDVSFSVQPGEVVGIIGRNGAGKSTLLKILSRITEPTEGRVELRGRVGSLLEVGTGFHPELTGRENVYLNGAILGMTRSEIDQKFDEIVAFAEIEKFIDTPVKRYSSGMYVRLAFAVAAHLEPEILMVDEVLAVGDAAFQKKCLGKMGDVAHEGRTVLFVSHNMAAVQNLCPRTISFEAGNVVHDGDTRAVIDAYLASGSSARHRYIAPEPGGERDAYFTRIELLNRGDANGTMPMGGDVTVELEFVSHREISSPVFSVRLSNLQNENIVAWRTQETFGTMPAASRGGIVQLRIEDLNLLPGRYYLSFGLTDGYNQFDRLDNILELEIAPRTVFPGGKGPTSSRGEKIYTPCSWTYHYD